MRFGDVPWVAAILYGIKPAVTAIVLFAAYRIAARALKYKPLWLISAAAFVAIFAFHVPFPAIVLTAGVIGYVWGRLDPKRFSGDGHGSAAASFGPALIDDGAVLPHTRFSAAKVIAFAVAGLALWLAALGALGAAFGWQGTLTQMGWFFTKAALLTFGGAYAVLPYVFQGTVEHYGWLTPTQMIDGLALGETTPGPLIMVVAFVGFVGGWAKALFGPEALLAAGVAGAAVATFFTFLPSFVFILVGGAPRRVHPRRHPLHRAAHRHHRGDRGRDRQPRGVLRVARVLAAGFRRTDGFLLDRAGDRRTRRAVALQGTHHPGNCCMRRGRTGAPPGPHDHLRRSCNMSASHHDRKREAP